jgi:hypothetical protein
MGVSEREKSLPYRVAEPESPTSQNEQASFKILWLSAFFSFEVINLES